MPPAAIVRGAGTIFSTIQGGGTQTTIRIITTSTRIRQGYGTTRIIHGGTGVARPTQSSGQVTGPGGGGMSGSMKTVMKIMKVLFWISCFLFVAATTVSLVKYFRRPAVDEVLMRVHEVNEEKAWYSVIWDMHDLSGLIIPIFDRVGGKMKTFAKEVLESDELGGKDVFESGMDWHLDRHYSINMERQPFIDVSRVPEEEGGSGGEVAGTRIVAGTDAVRISTKTVYNIFESAIITHGAKYNGKLLAINQIKEKLGEFVKGEAYSSEDNPCRPCGTFTLHIGPDQIPCVENRYTLIVKSVGRVWLDDNPGKEAALEASATAEATIDEMLEVNALPAWTKTQSGASFRTKADQIDFQTQLAQLEWTWIKPGGQEQGEGEFLYNVMVPTKPEKETYSFTNIDGDTNKIEFNWTAGTHDGGDGDGGSGDYNTCIDPYYWTGALESGHNEGDELRWGITHDEWVSSSDKLSEKTDLSLLPHGVPEAAVGLDDDGIPVPHKNTVRGVIRDAMFSPKDYARTHSSNKQMGYEKKIQPFVFNGYSLWVFGLMGTNFVQGSKELAKRVSRSSGEGQPIPQHFTSEEIELGIKQVADHDNKRAAGAPVTARYIEKTKLAVQKFKEGTGTRISKSGPVGEGELYWKGDSKTASTSNPGGKLGQYCYWMLYEEPSFTCGECQHTDYTDNNCTEILQSTTMAAAKGENCFYIGIDYCLAAKKEYRTLAEEGSEAWGPDDGWRTVKTGRGPDEVWEYTDAFSLPCSPGGATPSVDLGDVRGALEDVLGGSDGY